MNQIFPTDMKSMRFYVSEAHTEDSRELWRTLLEKAHDRQIQGCIVMRGFFGFGPHHGRHTEMDFEGSGELTMVLEFFDSVENCQAFFKSVETLLKGVLVVMPMKSHAQNSFCLRIFLRESDKRGRAPIYSEILKRALSLKMAGATAIRGVAGFGSNQTLHKAHLLNVTGELPIIIEIIDSKVRLAEFKKQTGDLLQFALVTEEPVEVLRFEQ